MGQKVNPHGLRVGVIKDWDSRWYAREDKVGDLVVEDFKIREYLKKTLYSAGVPTIEIERDSSKVRIYIHCSRPGVVIGKGGEEIARLEGEVKKLIGKDVKISIVEVRTPDTSAQLVAENIAQQLEKRIGFRRAMKNAMGRAMRMGARGIKIKCGGRLGGAEIARSETYHEGTIPLQTIRADIDYGFAEADTTYGVRTKTFVKDGDFVKAGTVARADTTAATIVRADTTVTTIAREATTAITVARTDRAAMATDLLSRTANGAHRVQRLPHRKEAMTDVNA